MSKDNPPGTKKGSLNVALISLLVAIAWIVFQSRNMAVEFIPQQVWFWLNTVIGWGLLIFLIILTTTGKVKLYNDDSKLDRLITKVDILLTSSSNILDKDIANKLIAAIEKLTEELKKHG